MELKEIKDKIFQYGFCDEQGNYVVVLNEEKLKEIFKADIVLLREEYR